MGIRTGTAGAVTPVVGGEILDATHQLVWHPAANANGDLAAFTVRAIDTALAISDTDRQVTIRYRIYADRIEIVVRDQGTGFDVNRLPHAAVSGDPFTHLDVRDQLGLRAGGFGLMICKGMVDELRYNDIGNEVTLIKRFEGSEADGPAS